MGRLEFDDLPDGALVLIDSAPIIYFLEGHPEFGPRSKPLFDAHASGRLRFAVTTITIAEVLIGPLRAGDEALARRYRAILESWNPVALEADVAESARLRASPRLKLPDAVHSVDRKIWGPRQAARSGWHQRWRLQIASAAAQFAVLIRTWPWSDAPWLFLKWAR